LSQGNKKPKTEKQLAAARKSIKKAAQAAWAKPRSVKQLAVSKAPRTKKPLATLKQLRSYPRTEKQLAILAAARAMPKKPVSAESIDCHHNDLCHGAKRPEDIIHVTHAEHARIHSQFRERDQYGKFI